jgi:CheY-like chemotaxis protein
MQTPLVLLVDDHADTREMFAQWFRMSGFSVVEAENGTAALEKAAAEPIPSIVVTDLRMPGSVSATQLCRELAQRGVPVIALTGLGPGPEHDDMHAAGCVSIMMKPVAPDRLIAEVQRQLSRSNQSEPTP